MPGASDPPRASASDRLQGPPSAAMRSAGAGPGIVRAFREAEAGLKPQPPSPGTTHQRQPTNHTRHQSRRPTTGSCLVRAIPRERQRATGSKAPRAQRGGPPEPVRGSFEHKRKLASFLVCCVLAASRAELLQLDPVRVVSTVLLGDVVAFFALRTRHRDLRSNVGSLGHCSALQCCRSRWRRSCVVGGALVTPPFGGVTNVRWSSEGRT